MQQQERNQKLLAKEREQQVPDMPNKERGRSNGKRRNDGADRNSRVFVSPHFDCTRHNVRREWLKWEDLGANGQVLEWIRHGVVVPWVPSGPPPPFNQGVSCRGLPRNQATFLHEEIERLKLSGVLRPVEYSRWVSRAFLVPKPNGSGWRLIVDLRAVNKHC